MYIDLGSYMHVSVLVFFIRQAHGVRPRGAHIIVGAQCTASAQQMTHSLVDIGTIYLLGGLLAWKQIKAGMQEMNSLLTVAACA